MISGARLDHLYHISHIIDHISGERFTILSKRHTIPSYVQMEKRNGPKKPERPKLYPSREVFQLYLSNGKVVWGNEISFEEHNLSRVRPGGRDETWTQEVFLSEIQTIVQSPSRDPSCLFQLRPIQDGVHLEIKSRKGDVVVNYLKSCELRKFEEIDAQTILERIEIEEISLINFFSSRGKLDQVQLYLEGSSGNIDLNSLEKGTWSAIQRAAYCGHIDVVRYLIEKGANPNIQSDDGMDPLFCAIKGGHLAVVQLLSESGALVKMDEIVANEVRCEGHLSNATKCRQREIVEYFCRPGGQIDLQLTSHHGTRKTGHPDPHRFFTTLDGYPIERSHETTIHALEEKKIVEKKQKKKQSHSHPHSESHHSSHHPPSHSHPSHHPPSHGHPHGANK